MEFLMKAGRFAVQCAVVALGCVVISAVLGLMLEGVIWAGNLVGLWDATGAFFRSIDNEHVNAWVESTGVNTTWLGYLLAMVALGLFGFFRGRK